MRKTLYAASGALMGAIIFIFLFTEIPEINIGETESKFLMTNQELVGLDSSQEFAPFFAEGTYHIDDVKKDEFERKGIISYGKANPMFYYNHVPEVEEVVVEQKLDTLVSATEAPAPENGDVKLSDPNSKGGAMIVKGDSILFDGFDLETRVYKQVEISEALFDYSASGVLPVKEENYHISSSFGLREDPFEKVEAMHTGTDFSSENINSSEVYSVNHGKVEKIVSGSAGYGNYIIINHNGYSTLYAHLESFGEIEEGDFVKSGAMIGKVGSTGRSTGPHLHFEVRIGEVTVDPEIFLNKVRGTVK